MLEKFLDRFYRTISFQAGESFPADRFRSLFRPDALLLERMENGGYRSKTPAEHIWEFETAVRDYPELFKTGFHERQTSVEWTEQEGIFLVRSHYEKRYTRSGVPVIETGINHMTILTDVEALRIACVIW